jgi:hypothetical protein
VKSTVIWKRLARIAQIGLVGDLVRIRGYAIGHQGLAGALAQLAQIRQQLLVAELFGHGQVGARRLVLHLRRGIAVGAQDPGARRHDHRPGLRENTQGVGVQRTGAAETHEGEVSRVIALLHGDQAQGAEHGFVDDTDDALRRFHEADTHGVRHFLHGLPRPRG